ncbi:hypothetical protein [Saccharothrix deserti]|uniref:hypothetical protein n=1 Tax=Saccharothrix deserti TaxID=2593674 RepID=UPI00131D213B|nr:hypothetical protein [Saccharothrix deserti]
MTTEPPRSESTRRPRPRRADAERNIALAVLVDAWLIRGVLAPAFMKLAGRANWWASNPLAALHDRLGLRE